jgi:DNA-directed RNA polymerase subunit omega
VQILNGIDSKFRLAILVARRAKQLIGGAKKKVECKSENPLTVAMEEFKQGKIDFDVLNEEETLFTTDSENLQGEVVPGEIAAVGEEVEGEADINAEDTEELEEETEPESES